MAGAPVITIMPTRTCLRIATVSYGHVLKPAQPAPPDELTEQLRGESSHIQLG